MAGVPRYFITGSSGFVGRHLVQAILAAHPTAAVGVLINRSESKLGDRVQQFRGDLTDFDAVAKAIEEFAPHKVIHLAAQSSVAQSVSGASRTWHINVGGSLSLAAAVSAHAPAATVLFVSSAGVYGDAYKAGTATELTVPQPQNAYTRSKYAAELMFQDVLPPSARLMIVRPVAQLGEGHDERFFLPSIAAQVARMEAGQSPPVLLVGDLSVELDFLHVDDAVDAYLRLVDDADIPASTYNVASETPRRLSDIVEIMRGQSKIAFEIKQDPSRLRARDIPRMSLDGSKLKKLTGWQPKRTIDNALLDQLNDWRARVR